MALRHDAGFAAASIVTFVRDMAMAKGGPNVATVGRFSLEPGMINVVPGEAHLTVDIRDPDESILKKAVANLLEHLAKLESAEGVNIEIETLVDEEPVIFDAGIVKIITETAKALGLSHQRMASGAGHDAQMMARIGPAAMIFVPSIGGVSHNPLEETRPEDLEAGANMLLQVMRKLAD